MQVEKMQEKLAHWSLDQDERFDDKFNVVYDMDFLHHAWKT